MKASVISFPFGERNNVYKQTLYENAFLYKTLHFDDAPVGWVAFFKFLLLSKLISLVVKPCNSLNNKPLTCKFLVLEVSRDFYFGAWRWKAMIHQV